MRENEEGADFLPMRLAAVLIIAAIVLVSAAVCATSISRELAKDAASDCAAKVAAVAKAEYTEGCPGRGDGTALDVIVPDCVESLTFGELMGTYSITYTDGDYETYLPGLPIGAGDPVPGRGMPAVIYPGNYHIRVAVEDIGGNPMALLYVEGK